MSGTAGVLQCIHDDTQYVIELKTFKEKLTYLYVLSWKTGRLGGRISRCSLGTGRVLNNKLNKEYV